MLKIDPDIFGIDILQGDGKEVFIKGFQYTDIGIDIFGVWSIWEYKFLFPSSDIICSIFVIEDILPILLQKLTIIVERIIFGRKIVRGSKDFLNKRLFE
jgi:hypothetical protein